MASAESSLPLSASSSLTCCSRAWEWLRGVHEKESSHLRVVHAGDHGHVRSDLSARYHRPLSTVVSPQGQRATDRTKRQAGWIANHWASLQRSRILPFAAVLGRDWKWIRPHFQQRLESGAHEQSLARPRQWRRPEVARRKSFRPDSHRPRHLLWLRARSRNLPGGGGVPSATSGARARHQRARAARARPEAHTRKAIRISG